MAKYNRIKDLREDSDKTQQELADYLGVERSAMSAEISKLVKLGILKTQRSQFKLLKPEE